MTVQPVDLDILADQVLSQLDVPGHEGLPGLGDLRAHKFSHLLEHLENLPVSGRLISRQGHKLGDVHTLIAHALHAADDMQQRGDEPQVAGDRRLRREQREHSLVDLEIATVDPIVVGEHKPDELHVLGPHRLQCALELHRHHVEPAHRLLFELPEGFRELVTWLKLHGVAYLNLPVSRISATIGNGGPKRVASEDVLHALIHLAHHLGLVVLTHGAKHLGVRLFGVCHEVDFHLLGGGRGRDIVALSSHVLARKRPHLTFHRAFGTVRPS